MGKDNIRRNLGRRAVVIALAAFSIFHSQSSIAQHYIGVKGGYGAASGRFQTNFGVPESAMVWNKYTAGVVWKYFSPQQIVGGLSAELEFQMRGYRTFDDGNGDISVVISDETEYRAKTRSVSSITLPLVWQPHLYMLNRRVRFFLSAGVTVTYNLGIGDKLTYSYYGFDADGNRTVTHQTTPYEMQTARDVRWNYGWLGGAGLSVLTGRWEIFAEGRYYYGMGDIMRTSTKYLFNEEEPIRSELDNIYISVGVTMRLGKGGILAPPLSKRRRAAAGEDNFTNIRTR